MVSSPFRVAEPLILASGSAIRRQLLKEAGLVVTVRPVSLDERALRDRLIAQGAPIGRMALELAHAKARLACEQLDLSDGALVLAADQILDCENRVFEKPADRQDAWHQLRILRGRTHVLHTALVLYRNGVPIWSHLETPRLTMRDFSDVFLESYLQQEGDQILACVGGYRLEGLGVQLFAAIEGAYDAVLGLPRLPLLNALRTVGGLSR